MKTQRIKSDSISSERQIFISGIAEYLIENHFSDEEMICPEVIADVYGISYSYGSYEDAFDGLLEYDNNEFHIYINTDRTLNHSRQRFTFAHELGHFFIDEHRNALANGQTPYHSSFTNFSSEILVEREADFFAACLLMPRTRILNEYKQYKKFSISIINHISKKYQTSFISTLFRLFYLDVHPLVIVYAKDGQVCWIMKSKDFRYYLRCKKPFIPENSIMYEYFKSGKKYTVTQQIWTGDWFYDRNEEKIYEYCWYYDRHKICYSIVWKD